MKSYVYVMLRNNKIIMTTKCYKKPNLSMAITLPDIRDEFAPNWLSVLLVSHFFLDMTIVASLLV